MSQSARRRAVRHQALRELVTQKRAAGCSMQCNFVDTTALLLWFDEGTLGQILPRFHHHTAPTSNFHAPVPRTCPTGGCQRLSLSCQAHFPCASGTGAAHRSSWSAPPVQTSKKTGKISPMSRAHAGFPTETSYPATLSLQFWLLGPWISDDPPPLLTTSAWEKIIVGLDNGPLPTHQRLL